MKLIKLNIIIAEFIPIIILLLYYLFKYSFIKFTHSILGKFCFIIIIMFYTIMIDILVGTAAALIFILYYQSDMIEGFYNLQINPLQQKQTETINENFENYQTAYETKIINIINKKINVEDELLMPKQINNVDIDNSTLNCSTTNPIGTNGVISEIFTPL